MGLVSALMDDRRNAIAIGDFSEKAIDQSICVGDSDELRDQTKGPSNASYGTAYARRLQGEPSTPASEHRVLI